MSPWEGRRGTTDVKILGGRTSTDRFAQARTTTALQYLGITSVHPTVSIHQFTVQYQRIHQDFRPRPLKVKNKTSSYRLTAVGRDTDAEKHRVLYTRFEACANIRSIKRRRQNSHCCTRRSARITPQESATRHAAQTHKEKQPTTNCLCEAKPQVHEDEWYELQLCARSNAHLKRLKRSTNQIKPPMTGPSPNARRQLARRLRK